MFEEAGLDNEAAVRATGRRFRDTLLKLKEQDENYYRIFTLGEWGGGDALHLELADEVERLRTLVGKP